MWQVRTHTRDLHLQVEHDFQWADFYGNLTQYLF